MQSFQTTDEDAGTRIDRFLCDRIQTMGRKLAGLLCAKGNVRVNGRRVRKDFPLEANWIVEIQIDAAGQAALSPEIPLNEVLLTEDLVVVEKPPGVPTGALIGKETGTMAGALLARYPEMADVGYGEREPGVVHRLDNYTSGLLLAARNQRAFLALREALSLGQIEKHYLAVVVGGVLNDRGEVSVRLVSDPRNSKRVTRASDNSGYAAQTRYQVVERGPYFDLVEARAHAAFRHQIRFHLAWEGAPLVGDVLYGGPENGAPRHALHASHISGIAQNIAAFKAQSPLPRDLRELLQTTSESKNS